MKTSSGAGVEEGMAVRGELWAIIYGADEDHHPELNQPSIFRETLARVAKVVSKKRIVAATTADIRKLWSEELRTVPAENRVELPYERGVPASALLAFFQVFRKEPTSRVLLIPANHRVGNEKAFLAGLQAAAEATPGDDNCAVLVGMREQDPLLPGSLLIPSHTPDETGRARKLIKIDPTTDPDERYFAVEHGASIFTGIFAAGSSAMLRLYDHAAPGMLRSFLTSLRGHAVWSPETLGRLFRFLPKKLLDRDLLQPSTELLRVFSVEGCGYSNLEHGDRLAPKILLAEPSSARPLFGDTRRSLELLPS